MDGYFPDNVVYFSEFRNWDILMPCSLYAFSRVRKLGSYGQTQSSAQYPFKAVILGVKSKLMSGYS